MTDQEKKHFENIGKSIMEGFLEALGKWVAIFCIFAWTLIAIFNTAGIDTDDSDTSGWNRSGLKIHTDAKTGVQYLSDGKGGLIRRD